MPSLKQLNEAVLAYIAENPDALVTVVVDASFGHRIDSKEVAEFDSAVSNNEIVAPPAGAIGRGDAFVLSIANKVKATILSNDSYQEFHGTYPWLFDEGRLIGGKPVPHIGWVFVNRLPVRGPTSRKSVNEAKRGRGAKTKASPEASQPMPVPSAPPPGAVMKQGRGRIEQKATAPDKAADGDKALEKAAKSADRTTERRAESKPDVHAKNATANDLLAFLNFVEHHQPGSSVNAIVESYSSHGAYVRLGDVRGYVPLSLMADPAPRSAREFMKIGESVTLVVESFTPGRRSIDLAMPTMATIKPPPVEAPVPAKAKRAARKVDKAAAVPAAVEPPSPPARKRAPKKAAVTEHPPAQPAAAAPVQAAAAPRKATTKKAIAKLAPVEAVPEPTPRATRKRAAKTTGTSAVTAAPAEAQQPTKAARRGRKPA